MGEEADHISEGLDHGGREPDGELFVIQDFAHLGLGLEDHEDGIEQLTPEGVPKFGGEPTSILDQGVEEIA
jgi:hypothetical protein